MNAFWVLNYDERKVEGDRVEPEQDAINDLKSGSVEESFKIYFQNITFLIKYYTMGMCHSIFRAFNPMRQV